jgi:glycine/D-amino acid oxidase-like deaminating enzyme
MGVDRRFILTSTLASLVPRVARAQVAEGVSPGALAVTPLFGTPDFGSLLAAGAPPLPIVCGWRPERRVGETAAVRLQSTRTPLGKTIIHNYGHCGSGVTLGLGCASLVERWLARQSFAKDARVVVVGAGIIGLSVAYVLKSRGYTGVRIIARAVASGDFDTATTVSDIAGGQFDAAGIDDISGDIVTDQDRSARMRTVLKESLEVLTARRGERNDPFLAPGQRDRYVYTVVRNYVINPLRIPPALDQASEVVADSPRLRSWMIEHYGPDALLPPASNGVVAPFEGLQRGRSEPLRFGVRNTVLINTANLISNIKRFIRSPDAGPRIRISDGDASTVRSFDDLQAIDADIVVNCTGLGGAVIGGDDPGATMTGRYGLLAKLPRIAGSFGRGAPRYLFSGFGYMFPRSDGTILGGAWDASGPWGLPRQPVEQIAAQPDAIRATYFSSLLQPEARDHARAEDMVRALGYFFMGRSDELSAMRTRLDWLSGFGGMDCAADRTACT